MMPTIVPVRMSKHCTARLKTPEPRYSTIRYRPAMTVPTSMGKSTVSSSPFRFGSKTTLRLKWCSERSLHSTSSSSSESSCSPCSRAGSGGAARRGGANGSAGAVLAPVRPGTHEGGRRARLKEDDAVLVANRRDIPSGSLECERRVHLRSWCHLRAIGRGFARRGFARRGVTLSARRGFLTNATIECPALAVARAVITVGSHCCGCCCGCSCWLVSVAQESLDRCSLPVISQPRSHALQGEHASQRLGQS